MTLVSDSKTPQEMRNSIVRLILHQATGYDSDARIAQRKKVKEHAIAKADALRFMAKAIEEIKIV